MEERRERPAATGSRAAAGDPPAAWRAPVEPRSAPAPAGYEGPPRRPPIDTTPAETGPSWLRSVRRSPRGWGSTEIPVLTDQFFTTLRAYAAEVEEHAGEPPSRPLERVRLLLERGQNEPTWLDAYEIEQQLVHLMPPATLRAELKARVIEAQAALKSSKACAYADMVKPDLKLSEEEQRGVLARLVNDLQWTYTVNEAKRQFWIRITRLTTWFFAGFGATFVLLFLWVFGGIVSQPSPQDPLDLWLGPKGLLLVLAAGAWGASFSMLLGLKKVSLEKVSLDQLKVMKTYGVFAARVCIGAGGALVLLFFFVSEFLSGSIFPRLKGLPNDADPKGIAQIVLLVLWCFVAGFSEKLIPGLLSDSERRALGARSERQPGEVDRGPPDLDRPLPGPVPPRNSEEGGRK
jgi:hypothetical protein